jgi:type I restriction enzyme S subunit
MGGEWQYLPFTEAVVVNPTVPLKRGEKYPFVDMQAIDPSKPTVGPSRLREFSGGGARFEPYDTLMARITPCLENGKIARYVPDDRGWGPAFGSTEFIVIRGREGVTDNDFAFYLTRWTELRSFAIAQMSGSSGRQRVPAEALAGFEVPVPPLPEQRAIARILGTLDDKIGLNRRMNETLEAMAQALFKSWFVDFDPVVVNAIKAGNPIPEKFAERAAHYRANPDALGLPEDILGLFPARFVDSALGPIPEGWEVGTLGDLVGFLNGYAFKSNDWRDRGIPVIKIGSVKPGIVDLNSVSYVSDKVAAQASRYRLHPGDLLISMTGYVGEVGLVPPTENPPLLNQRVGKFVFEKVGTGSLGFVYCFTRRPQFKAEVKAKSHGTAQSNVSSKAILSIPVILPPNSIRELFNRSCKPFFDQILSNWAESRTLATLRDTLLPKLISGELRVPDVEKILEDAV